MSRTETVITVLRDWFPLCEVRAWEDVAGDGVVMLVRDSGGLEARENLSSDEHTLVHVRRDKP